MAIIGVLCLLAAVVCAACTMVFQSTLPTRGATMGIRHWQQCAIFFNPPTRGATRAYAFSSVALPESACSSNLRGTFRPVEAHGTSKSTGISSAAATVRIRSSGTDYLPYSHSCTTRSALAPV